MQLYQEFVLRYEQLVAYIAEHPIVLTTFVLFIVLAVIGAWYVLSHHLHVLIITLLCSAGFASGVLVLYRGLTLELQDLQVVGAFLIAIFPIVYQQAIRVARIAYGPPSAIAKGHAKRAAVKDAA
jgi:hypothetical protein